MTMADERIGKGLALADRMFGAEGGSKRFKAATEFTQPLNDFAVGTCFGEVWQRPGLDHKTRSMLTIAMLTALGQQPQLRVHVRGALSNGVTKEEIREILTHAIIYCGLPKAVDAFNTAGEVLDKPA
jgi:4-carboxymuconolactone decarboxylase